MELLPKPIIKKIVKYLEPRDKFQFIQVNRKYSRIFRIMGVVVEQLKNHSYPIILKYDIYDDIDIKYIITRNINILHKTKILFIQFIIHEHRINLFEWFIASHFKKTHSNCMSLLLLLSTENAVDFMEPFTKNIKLRHYAITLFTYARMEIILKYYEIRKNKIMDISELQVIYYNKFNIDNSMVLYFIENKFEIRGYTLNPEFRLSLISIPNKTAILEEFIKNHLN